MNLSKDSAAFKTYLHFNSFKFLFQKQLAFTFNFTGIYNNIPM